MTDTDNPCAVNEANLEKIQNEVKDLGKKVDKNSKHLAEINGGLKVLQWIGGVALAIGGWFAGWFSRGGN